jgi:energy-coupling factor transport system substrate-specific component
VSRVRPWAAYLLVSVVGALAFLWPFVVPARAVAAGSHSGDAPLVAAAVAGLAVVAVVLELRTRTMNGTTVALLGVLSAMGGLLRLLDLPGGGSGIFFLVVLAGAAFGPRFGLLLGLSSMLVSAVVTGGVGPWLPFQMLALAWMGAGAGLLGRLTARLPGPAEVAALALYAWLASFAFGAIMNLWFWPFVQGDDPLSYQAGLAVAQTLQRYLRFYAVTSLPWDAAGAIANAALIAVTAHSLLPALRRHAERLRPVVVLDARPLRPGVPSR